MTNDKNQRNEEHCEWCEHCLYVGDGGFWCDEKERLIADEWDFSGAKVCRKYEESKL